MLFCTLIYVSIFIEYSCGRGRRFVLYDRVSSNFTKQTRQIQTARNVGQNYFDSNYEDPLIMNFLADVENKQHALIM